MTNVISTSNGIVWNMSNCEIQTIMINTDKKVFQLQTTETYSVINKCDNSVLSEYKEKTLSCMSISIIFLTVILGFFTLAILDIRSNNRLDY